MSLRQHARRKIAAAPVLGKLHHIYRLLHENPTGALSATGAYSDEAGHT